MPHIAGPTLFPPSLLEYDKMHILKIFSPFSILAEAKRGVISGRTSNILISSSVSKTPPSRTQSYKQVRQEIGCIAISATFEKTAASKRELLPRILLVSIFDREVYV